MTLSQLYELLELDTPADFTYFEQMADLIESEEDIQFDLFVNVLSQLDSDTAEELVENYFEEFNNAIPDADDDFVCLVDSVKQSLILLALDIENQRREFSEKLYYFRTWLHAKDGATIDGKSVSVLDAVTEHRCEKLGIETHKYSFPSVKDYELENLSMNIGTYSKVDILKEDNEDYSKNFDN